MNFFTQILNFMHLTSKKVFDLILNERPWLLCREHLYNGKCLLQRDLPLDIKINALQWLHCIVFNVM